MTDEPKTTQETFPQPETTASPTPEPSGASAGGPRSLRELIDRVSGRGFHAQLAAEEAGILETLPFPFLALVGQREMKLALILALINPAVGGVLLIGPRGTGKTTAVRSLVDLLPEVPRSLCYYGCMPEDIEAGGIDAVCPECAQKYGRGEPLARLDSVRLIELPLNARMEDVVGGLDERAAAHERLRIRRGLLAQADRNLLYIDEVNLLDDEITDAILDAAAQGRYTVRRGPITATYRSRFTLIGSMNPEEGRLRPQIMDRFGLRVLVRGLSEAEERLEAYRRVHAYQTNPRKTVAQYTTETAMLREEIQAARDTLSQVILPEDVAERGLAIVRELQIDSLRAEITLFEAARAYAAADGRLQITPQDLYEVAPMALRARRSNFMLEFFASQQVEETEIQNVLEHQINNRGES
ncbi:MAG: magnesium chelatase [Anaerolineales bacterium]|nr:magnesium chelatase [Anaerolineales bacterium]